MLQKQVEMTSLDQELDDKGYLTLNKFVKYMKDFYPASAVSYPTAKRMIEAGKIRAQVRGSQLRILKSEVERWVAEGNLY